MHLLQMVVQKPCSLLDLGVFRITHRLIDFILLSTVCELTNSSFYAFLSSAVLLVLAQNRFIWVRCEHRRLCHDLLYHPAGATEARLREIIWLAQVHGSWHASSKEIP